MSDSTFHDLPPMDDHVMPSDVRDVDFFQVTENSHGTGADTNFDPASDDPGVHDNQLGAKYMAQYQESGSLEDLRMVLKHAQAAVDSTPEEHPQHAIYLMNLGLVHSIHWDDTRSLASLKSAAKFLQAGLDKASSNAQGIVSFQHLLAQSYHDLYIVFEKLDDLKSALKNGQVVAQLAVENNDQLVEYWETLAGIYADYFEVTGKAEDLDLAISYRKSSVDAGSDFARGMHKLAALYNRKYEAFGDFTDLKSAIDSEEAAVSCASGDDIQEYKSNLSYLLIQAYNTTEDIQHLQSAIGWLNKLASEIPSNQIDYADCQHNLAMASYQYFEKTKNIEYLDSTIQHLEDAITATSSRNQAEITKRQHLITKFYKERWHLLSTIADLEQAIKYYELALTSATSNHFDHADWHFSLGGLFVHHYQHVQSPSDLDLAIKHLSQAVNLISEEHPDMAKRLVSLALPYTKLYQRQRNSEHLERAIQLKKKAVEIASESDPLLAMYKRSLAETLAFSFQESGQKDHLEAALKYVQSALSEMEPTLNTALYAGCQAILGDLYIACFSKWGKVADLETSLRHRKLAVSYTEENSNMFVQSQLALAQTYGQRFERLKDITDLKMAIKLGHSAAEAKDTSHLINVNYHLGSTYLQQYDWFKDTADIHYAIEYFKRAVELAPVDHAELPRWLQGLAASLARRYHKLRDDADLNAAIEYDIRAVGLTSQADPNLPSRQHNLAISLFDRYRKKGNLLDLDLAFETLMNAISVTPAGHPYLAARQYNLALLFVDRFQARRDVEDLHCALYYFRTAVATSTGSPDICWGAATDWAEFARHYQLPECVYAYQAALCTLPELIWLGNTVNVRQAALTQYDVSIVAADAAATCLAFGKSGLAVECVERGLSITYQQLLQLRDDFGFLHERVPELAAKLKDVSKELQETAAVDHAVQKLTDESQSTLSRHTMLAIEREDLIREIRNIPELKDFMLPASYEKLSVAAENGPVIILNCTANDTTLPGVNHSVVEMQLNSLRRGLEMCKIEAREEEERRHGRLAGKKQGDPELLFQQVLSWLYQSIVKPIIEALHANKVHEGRIWWCPTGPLVYMPLHAAALHDGFLQSYTFTLSMLINARLKKRESQERDISITAIDVPEVLNKSRLSLPGVEKELQKIKEMVGKDNVHTFFGKEATLDKVYSALPSVTWLHLACHGEQLPLAPLKSALLLYDQRLELEKIMHTSIPNAELVFLSACQTAMGDANLTNESMHLAGGLMFAGFPSAIATLWSISDRDGPKIAESVYEYLFKVDGQVEGKPDASKAAAALEFAVKKLKADKAPFHRWAAFVHVGI